MTLAVRPNWCFVALSSVAALAAVTCQVSLPLLLKHLIDGGILAGAGDVVIRVAWMLVVVAVLAFTLESLSKAFAVHEGASALARLRDDVAGALRRLPYGAARRHDTGDLMAAFTSDAVVIAEAYKTILSDGIPGVMRVVATLIAVGLSHPFGLALAAGSLGVFLLTALVLQRRLDAAAERRQTSEARLLSRLGSSLRSTRDIIAFDAIEFDRARLRSAFDESKRGELAVALVSELFRINMIIYWIIVTAAYAIGGHMVIDGAMTFGALSAIVAYIWMVQTPASTFVGLIAERRMSRVSRQRLSELLRHEDAAIRPASHVLPAHHGIRFDNVGFEYEGGVPTLTGVSFAVPPGGSLAIIGPSGAGKSTILALMMGLYAPTSGRIELGGVDMSLVAPAERLRTLAAVFQDPAIFPGTVEDNIRYGAPYSRGDVIRAARLAEADAFITSLPAGYDTVVGEGFRSLSGGELQRLALARALLRRPAILVLDEPTSALDMATEEALRAACLRKLRAEGVTLIVITHNTSLANDCDHMVAIEAGRVAYQRSIDDALGGVARSTGTATASLAGM